MQSNTQYRLMCEGLDILRTLQFRPDVLGLAMSQFWASQLLIHSRSDLTVDRHEDPSRAYVSWTDIEEMKEVMWKVLPTLKGM